MANLFSDWIAAMGLHCLSRPAVRHVVFVGLAAWCGLSFADVIDIAWSPAGGFERAVDVPAGKFAEICGKLPKGATVKWAFAADRPMAFNIHYHVDKEVIYPVRQEGAATSAGELVAPLDQDYCWMWTNKSAMDARATLTLRR